MKPLVNTEWMNWLSNKKDERGYAKLKEDTPEKIKKEYEEYKMNYERYRNKFLAKYEEDK